MAHRILVVDDSEVNREFLREILCDEYKVETAEDGSIALFRLSELRKEICAVLLDLHMPNMDGFETMEEMQKRNLMKEIPVLVITGECSAEVENECFQRGVSDFIRKPFEPSVIKKRVKNIVELFEYRRSLEEQIENQTRTLRRQYRLLQDQAARLRESNMQIIDVLGTVVEYRNMESGEHIKRVKEFTRTLAWQVMKDYPEYRLDGEKIELIVSASSLHDIGKIAIPDQILLKPGKLTDEEYECMKTHTTKGYDILDSIEGVWNDEHRRYGCQICLYHHERFDGRGYPEGLQGDKIPLAAQLVSVADVYDALVSERCYKKAFSKEEAFHMIITGQCGAFSPRLIYSFFQVRPTFESLAAELN